MMSQEKCVIVARVALFLHLKGVPFDDARIYEPVFLVRDRTWHCVNSMTVRVKCADQCIKIVLWQKKKRKKSRKKGKKN